MKIKYTNEERDKILANKNVSSCGVISVVLTNEFKVRALNEYFKGKSPRKIFEEAGLTMELLQKDKGYYYDTLKRWRGINKVKGEAGILKGKRGIPKKKKERLKDKSDKEAIKFLEAKVEYLEAENSFLKKLRAKK